MERKTVLSFDEFFHKKNESDLFGVTTSSLNNLPPGSRDYADDSDYDYEGERDIDPVGSPNHKLKLIEFQPRVYTTNENDVALLEGPDGKKYIWYWGSTSDNPDLWEGTLLSDGEIDENSVEVAANRLGPEEFGKGLEDWEAEQKQIVEIDEDLAEELVDWLDEWRSKTRDSKLEVIKKAILKHLEEKGRTLESVSFGSDLTENKKGINPKLRGLLLDFLEKNPKASFGDAKQYIQGSKGNVAAFPGWKLDPKDFEEAVVTYKSEKK